MARKKKSLPFVVQPRLAPIIEQIGNEDSGILEIERRGYLNVAEKALVQYGMEDETSIRDLYALAGRIARETGKTQVVVIEAMSTQPMPDFLTKWEAEIAAVLMQMMSYNEKNSIVRATALIISRIDSTWTADQTLDLHPDIVAGLAELYNDEDKKSVDALEEKQTNTPEDVEKKS
jgi:hypothetical protein